MAFNTDKGVARGAAAQGARPKFEGSEAIAESADITALKDAIAAIKQELLDIVFETDDIRLQENPRLEVDYAVKIGCFENEHLKADIAMRRAKRRFALAQAKENRGEAIDPCGIDKQVAAEFEEWEQQLASSMSAYFDMLDRRASMEYLSPASSDELRKLYLGIVKRLHPDVSPSQSEQEKRLFLVAQSCYANGDLAGLRAVSVTMESLGTAKPEQLSCNIADELAAQLAMLEATKSVLGKRLDDLKNGFPYCLKEQLGNPLWISARVQEITDSTKELGDIRAEYELRYEQLVKSGGKPEAEEGIGQ